MSCNASFRRAVVAVLPSRLGGRTVLRVQHHRQQRQPAAGALLRPTTLPATGIFRHWDLREFDNCEIPYAINLAGTADIVGIASSPPSRSRYQLDGSHAGARVTRAPAQHATAAQAQDGENLLWWTALMPVA